MTKSEIIYNVIKSGKATYAQIEAALPKMTSKQIYMGISYLKWSDCIITTGRGKMRKITINPDKVYTPYHRLNSREFIENQPISVGNMLPSNTTTQPVNETPPVQDMVSMPDFNRMFLDLVEVLGDQIAAKAKERAYAILNTPKISEEFAQELMSRFSLPVVVFGGPETTSLTFNTPNVHPSQIHVPSTLNVPDQFVKEHPEAVVKVDPSLMQEPKTPEIEPERVRLPRICVTGMKPVEAGKISQEFSETFDLVFWNDRNGDGIDQLKAHAKHCDAMLWHVKHGSHSSEAIARDGSALFFRVNGDLTSMRKKLREYFYELKHKVIAA